MVETGNGLMIQIVNGKPSVTSLQVAHTFEKEHKNVLRDIEQVLSQVSENFGKLNFELSEYLTQNNLGFEVRKPMYLLSKDGFTMLTMGYAGEKAMRFKEAYIARFNEMERALQVNAPTNLPEALRAYANMLEENELIRRQRDEAIRTKAEIGCRREATAMATASAAVRKVNTLEDKLGFGLYYKQVKGIPWLLDEFDESRAMFQQVGKKLKSLSTRMGYEVKVVPCPEYPEGVKAYHVDVVNAFLAELRQDLNMLGKYRKQRRAA